MAKNFQPAPVVPTGNSLAKAYAQSSVDTSTSIIRQVCVKSAAEVFRFDFGNPQPIEMQMKAFFEVCEAMERWVRRN